MLQSTRGGTAAELLNSAAATAAVQGSSKQIRPQPGDNVSDDQQQFKFACSVTANGGSGSPTCQVVIHGSIDGQTWFPIANGTAFAADNAAHEEFCTDVNGMVMPPYVRAVTVPGGTTPPTSMTVKVWVTSNADFTIS